MAWKIRYYFIVGLCLVISIGTPLGMFLYGYRLPAAFPVGVCFCEILIMSFGMLGVLLDAACNSKAILAAPARRHAMAGIVGVTWMLTVAGLRYEGPIFLLGARIHLDRKVDPKKLQSWADMFPNEAPAPKDPSHPDDEFSTIFHLSDGEALAARAEFSDGNFELKPQAVPAYISNLFDEPDEIVVQYSGRPGTRSVKIGNSVDRFGLYILIEPPGSPPETDLFRWQDRVYIRINGGG